MRIRISFGPVAKSLLIAGMSSGAMMAAVNAANAQAVGYTFTTIDIAGASNSYATGINDKGQIAGYSVNASGQRYAFLDSDGTITTFPSVNLGGIGNTGGINDAGQIVGTVSSPQSFLLTNGTFTYFSATGSTWTMATDINDAGQITGNELTAQGVWVGFLDSGGTFTTFAPAGATATVPYGINDSGQIVGYATVGGKSFSFVDTNGTFKTISVPGTLVLSTAASGINDQGDIVGTFTGPSGFLDTNGTFTTFAVPGAEATFVNGVNDAGDIVGYYYVVNGPDQGFLATPDASPIDVGPLPVMAGTIPGGMLVLGWLGRCLARRRQA